MSRRNAAELLNQVEYGPKDHERIVTVLIKAALEDRERWVRADVIKALEHFWRTVDPDTRAKVIIPALQRLMKDKDAVVASTAFDEIQKIDPRYEDLVPIDIVFRNRIYSTRITAEEKNIRVVTDFPEGNVFVQRRRLFMESLEAQVIDELIYNALQYTPTNGTITITLKREGGEAVFSVKDTGIGIPEAERDRVWLDRYRASNVGAVKGTGRGLSMMRSVVADYHGQIDFESKEGKGTTFFIRLPIDRAMSTDHAMTAEEMLKTPGLKSIADRWPDRGYIVGVFLRNKGPWFRQVFNEVNAMSISDIRNELASQQKLSRAEKPFPISSHIPAEEVFYFPTAGGVDWPQAMSNAPVHDTPENDELRALLRPYVRAVYMMFRLFANFGSKDIPVFSADMLEGRESLYVYLLSEQVQFYGSIDNYLRMLACVDFLTELLTSIDPRVGSSLADEIKNAWKDPSKEHIREGIRNYVRLMGKLEAQREVPAWGELFRRPSASFKHELSAYPAIERQRKNFELLKSLVIADVAMAADVTGIKKGGIDLDPAQMSMDVKKESQEFRFDFDPKGVDLNNIEGAEFVIRQMTHVTNLPAALGSGAAP